MYKEDLKIVVKISYVTLAKLGKNQIVRLDVLEKICEVLGDMVIYVEES